MQGDLSFQDLGHQTKYPLVVCYIAIENGYRNLEIVDLPSRIVDLSIVL